MILDYYKPENFFKQNTAYYKFKDSFDSLLNLFNESEELKDTITGMTIQNEEQTACSLIFAQSQETIISILLLCNEGNRSDAGILLRSLYEYYIQCKYIILNKQGIPFLNYIWVGFKKFQDMSDENIVQMNIRGSKEFERITQYINSQYENIKQEYLTKSGNIRNRWSKLSLRDMAKTIGEEKSYKQIMNTYSPYVHCDVVGMIDMMIPGEKNTGFDNSPKIEGIDSILKISYAFFGRIVTELALSYKIQIPKLLSQFIEK